jgi:dihydroneopterin aldolase
LSSRDNDPPHYSITLEGMTFYAYHGVNQEERELGQRFVVDLTVETDMSVPGRSDELSDTVDYSEVYKTVKAVVEGETYNLLEAVAEAVARHVLASFPVAAVRARVTKPSPPIKGAVLDGVSVEVYRVRQP